MFIVYDGISTICIWKSTQFAYFTRYVYVRRTACETIGCSHMDNITKLLFVPWTSSRCHAAASVSTVVYVNGAHAKKSYFSADVQQKKRGGERSTTNYADLICWMNTFQYKTDVSQVNGEKRPSSYKRATACASICDRAWFPVVNCWPRHFSRPIPVN